MKIKPKIMTKMVVGILFVVIIVSMLMDKFESNLGSFMITEGKGNNNTHIGVHACSITF
ncbi:hypothetical protein [Paenibacillus macquariensis]|uniref:Phr family secreted Rap phosphatase inhibitor n=2 Tax=Paenibacillus macquariensis TaxID=948756 RepID=A0ABY1JUE6_9BACL|nr:hypothetical protein [Paenibacillus macquariensis]SIQ79338.1 hypothetical protein SAMN05421578_10476 [Paenibacillus macquariensis]